MSSESSDHDEQPSTFRLKKLTVELILQIDEFLASLRESGEVRLILQNGELRFINKSESHLMDGESTEEN